MLSWVVNNTFFCNVTNPECIFISAETLILTLSIFFCGLKLEKSADTGTDLLTFFDVETVRRLAVWRETAVIISNWKQEYIKMFHSSLCVL